MPEFRHDDQVEIRPGLSISRFGLGTATLGGMYSSVSENDAHDAIQSALGLPNVLRTVLNPHATAVA